MLALLLAAAAAAQPPQVADGARVFARSCAPCHGTGPGIDGSPQLPGTAALQAKYKGDPPAALERRGGLDADVLRVILRNGQGAMPMFRKPELTDGDIAAIAAYLKTASEKR